MSISICTNWYILKVIKWPNKNFQNKTLLNEGKKNFWGPTEIWTRIAGFKVQSANHYTMGPCVTCDFAFMVYKSGSQGQWKEFIYTKMRMILHIFLQLCKCLILRMILCSISSNNSCVRFDESGQKFCQNFIVPVKTC